MKILKFVCTRKTVFVLGIALFGLIVVILMWKSNPFIFVKLRELVVSSDNNERKLTILSDIYEINQFYKSMKGPQSTKEVILSKSEKPELLWITGFRAVMVGPDGNKLLAQEFMCHSNLDIDIVNHREIFGWQKNNPTTRLFTLSQGQYEIKFPEGFGIPILSTEPLSLSTQVLNLNYPQKKFEVRHRITISYIRDRDLKKPMEPLIQVSGYGLKILEGKDGYYDVEIAKEDTHGSSCLVGENADTFVYEDSFTRKFSGHWVVKPGRETNHTLVTKILDVPYDTTIHYIAVHLHPFADSLELRDLTTGDTVFKSKVTGFDGKIGIEKVEYFSSKEGIPIFKDHEYQIISVYNNTSNQEQDSMAVMFLYLLDKEYQNPRIVEN